MKTGARALDLLRKPPLWIAPLIVGSVLIAIITVLYVGSTVDPVSHMKNLPVSVVNLDRGASAGGKRVDLGSEIESALPRFANLAGGKLAIDSMDLAEARERMDSSDAYATVVVPPGFSADALTLAGVPTQLRGPPHAPTVQILANKRAGTEGASLATGVLGPMLTLISRGAGKELLAAAPSPSAATEAALADPIVQRNLEFRPLPSNSALGLSAFYISLLILMCGFMGAAIVNGVLDGALGFAPSEIGPRWEMRRPVLISRLQTLLAKWAIVACLTGVLVGLMLVVAGLVLGLDVPEPFPLWLYGWLGAATVAIGTLALIAAIGIQGQLLALIIFIYLGLASAGGTTPVQALPGVLATVSHLDPLRQILGGVRSFLYFEGRGDAGLDQGLLFTLLGLAFWLAFGSLVVRWYDRKGRYRLDPGLLGYINDSVDKYRAEKYGAES